MTKASAHKLARQLRARGQRVRIFRHRGLSWNNLLRHFYTVETL